MRQRVAAIAVAGGLMLVAGCQGGDDSSGQADGSPTPTTVAPAAQLALSPTDGTADVSPTTPVQLSVTDGTLGEVSVTDAAGTVVEGTVAEAAPAAAPAAATSGAPESSPAPAAADATSVWTPAAPLAYGTTYTLTAEATNAEDDATSATTTFTTVAPGTLSTPSIGPLDGTTVGVGMPIRVYFDQPVTDRAAVESHLAVTSSTPTDGRWSWMNDSEVHFRPSTYWPANSEVTLDADLYGVDMGGGVWGEKDRSVSFAVGSKHVSVADAGTHTLTVYADDQVVQTYPMSAGGPENPTRNGPHVVLEKRADITMDSSTFGLAVDAPGGYRTDVQFATRISNNGEFVHAAPWSVGQQGSSNVSHGCINLSTDRAQWFFDFSQPGDVVEVVNSAGPTLSSVDGDIYDWAIPWDQWVAGSAL
ncbi:Ig-like domain-containing protein [Modestobacter sp. Leaf380]|uniref:L,D-transpeptidase n=1 Tax=Modestobacter sp. Leaf380 TaxID=1736356 RepID=UPI0006F84264|nr:Ig-like domain-containing protein [Modestobacter sp. Leaf380]KQS66111.1 hypothetical protein ASG41_12180 [Modestobacter sp. Leaf380]